MTYDVAVVGGGPAGASAALFVAKAGKKTLLIDADKGMTRRAMVYNFYGVPEIRGPDLVDTGHQQAVHFGAELIKAAVTDVKKTEDGFRLVTEQGDFHARYVILATGATADLAAKIGVESRPATEPRIKTVLVVDPAGRTNIPGIWAAGTVAGVSVQVAVTAGDGARVAGAAASTAYRPGEHVGRITGGMGRVFRGGYTECRVGPASQVIPIRTDLPWEVVGALPEMLQTAFGSLTVGLDLQRGQSLLIRGGTSSVGLAAAALAREMGATVLATTRQRERLASLAERGIDHPILDRGEIAPQVRALFPQGVDATLQPVRTPTLEDSLPATPVHGTVCSTGMVSNQWIVPDFYPIGYIPSGVRLTGYGGDAGDLPQAELQRYLDAVAAGRFSVPIHKIYELAQIQEAHATMEKNQAVGKLVVRVRHSKK